MCASIEGRDLTREMRVWGPSLSRVTSFTRLSGKLWFIYPQEHSVWHIRDTDKESAIPDSGCFVVSEPRAQKPEKDEKKHGFET